MIDGWLDWLIDWLTDWLPDCLTDWLTEWLTDWLTDWMNEWTLSTYANRKAITLDPFSLQQNLHFDYLVLAKSKNITHEASGNLLKVNVISFIYHLVAEQCSRMTNALTCRKSILLHSVPVVQELNEVAPVCVPEGAECIAIQLTSAVPLEPSRYSEIHVLNPFWFSDSTQIAPPLPRVGFLTEWPNEAKTWMSFPPLKGSANWTCSQANSPGLAVVTLTFPALKLAAVNAE